MRKHGSAAELETRRRLAGQLPLEGRTIGEVMDVWKILRNLAWTPQKPEQQARESDDDAIGRWRKQDWPRIKKGRAKR